MNYEMQTIIDSVNDEVEKRTPKRSKINKDAAKYRSYQKDYNFDIDDKMPTTDDEWIEYQLNFDDDIDDDDIDYQLKHFFDGL